MARIIPLNVGAPSAMYNYGLLLILLDFLFDVAGGVSQLEVDRHLQLGKEFLSKGQLQDALSQYHAAVEGDGQNYLTYYKRGTVYLALSKAKLAISDFDQALLLKPDFTAARVQRGIILLKLAELEAAEEDFNEVLSTDPNHEEAINAVFRLEPVREDLKLVEKLLETNDHSTAVTVLTRLIEVCPWSSRLRELRANCHVHLGDYQSAVLDMRSTTKLLADNTEGYFNLSTLLYRIGQVQESLKEIRECLKLDPEHKKCFPFYKKVKKIHKFFTDAEAAEQSGNFEGCIESAERVLKLEQVAPNVRFAAYQLLCRAHTGANNPEKAVKNCQEALKIQKDPSILCDSAEAYLAEELYDDAIRHFKEALEIDENNSRAKSGLQKAQQRQKMSEKRDYYKILGVPRTASKRQIIKAYRKAAQKWHPDNFQDEVEKKRAEDKFINIAAAKEVLTDDEKRAKFDNGEDPLDPESGKHPQGFNPFQEFHHFHSSPFHFKFNFN